MQLYLIISEKLVEDGAPQLNLKSLFGFTSSREKGLKLSPVFCGAVGWGLLDLRVMILGLAVLEVLLLSQNLKGGNLRCPSLGVLGQLL